VNAQPVIEAVSASGTLLAGAAAWRANLRSRRLEGSPPYRRLKRVTHERDEARAECRDLRAQCRKLLKEAGELKAALGDALAELVKLHG
jgi:hypothetical protein